MKQLIVLVLFFCSLLFQFCDAAALASPSIVVNLPSRTLSLFKDGSLVKVYSVAIGSPATPTPLGAFKVFNKEVNPSWYPPGKDYHIDSGPDNPLGYRWMEFSPTYGIHGTNRPDSIGTVVSNGCIRMNERDVEELFAQVPLGTPVTIIYDRVQVRLDTVGQASVGIYPDVYGVGGVTVGNVKAELSQYGLADFVSDDKISQLVDDVSGVQVIVATVCALKVNDRLLDDKVVIDGSRVSVPVDSVARALKKTFLFDENNHVVKMQAKSVPGVRRGSHIYVVPEDIQTLFGGSAVLNSAKNEFVIQALRVKVNDKPYDMDIEQVGAILALPVEKVADSLGVKLLYSSNRDHVFVGGQEVLVTWIQGQPYLQINKINEFFGACVYYNEQAQTIELTYPAP